MTQLGKYTLHEELGRGGFGTVYRATDTTLGREVALKVLHPQLTTDPDFLDKFRKEARTVAQLKSRDIVTIHELGEVDGRVFIAMEYMEGGSLKDKLEKDGALSFDQTLRVMRQVCAGLDVAHKKGLVHRDIKPANILFDSEGNAVISDFGLAKAVSNSSVSAMSSMGVAGTPAYRAPELWLDQDPSFATDIYSLGCVLYEMVIGKVLFDAKTPDGIITQHLVIGPQITDRIEVEGAGDIRAVIAGCLMKDPAQRYGKISTLLAALELPRQNEGRETVPDLETKGCEPVQAKAAEEKPLVASVSIQTKMIERQLGIGSTMISEKDGMTMVYVPAGEFLMGSRDDDLDADGDEKPQHTVHLDAYWIDETPVTNVMFAKFLNREGQKMDKKQPWINTGLFSDAKIMTKNGLWQVEDGCEHHPVVNVTWFGAQAYAHWAGKQLPSEAQWEKAARGTDGRVFPWGHEVAHNNANFYFSRDPFENMKTFGSRTTPVGFYNGKMYDSFQTLDSASPYGIYDMAGNVWQWTGDDYDSQHYRYMRGGSKDVYELNLRTWARNNATPTLTSPGTGFRCVQDSNQE